MAIIGQPLSVLSLKALIHVTTMPGASVKFTHGSISATLTANGSGNCDYEVRVPDFGTWSITSTSGYASGSASVNVAAVAVTYNVTVTLIWYFIQNGNWTSGIGHSIVQSGGSGWFKDDGNYILAQTYQGGSNTSVAAYMTPAVSFTGYWKTLYIDSQQIGDRAYAGVATNTSANPPNFSASVRLCGRIENWDSRHTSSVSVSGVRGSHYLALEPRSWAAWDGSVVHGSGGNIRVWNMWLSG